MKACWLSDEAEDDLQQAISYYETQQVGVGCRLLAAFEAACQRIENDLESCSTVRQGCRRRRVVKFPYDIIFSIEPDRLLIVAVAHHHRRPGYWKRRQS